MQKEKNSFFLVGHSTSFKKSINKFINFSTISKKPSDSLYEISFDFLKDHKEREEFASSRGGIRGGKILETLDFVAGRAAYLHTDGLNPNKPLTIVTASCDKIFFTREPSLDRKLRLRGLPIFTGNSSIEVKVVVDQLSHDETTWDFVLCSFFTMVALDKTTGKSTKVPPIVPVTEVEKKLFEVGRGNKEEKLRNSQIHLFKTPPTSTEMSILHQKFIEFFNNERKEQETGIPNLRYVTPLETHLESHQWMHPSYKNLHGKIFGGTLMRQAFELAYITGTLFSARSSNACNTEDIHFLFCDEIHFIQPVSIGDIVAFSSEVVYSDGDYIHVRVQADVIQTSTFNDNTLSSSSSVSSASSETIGKIQTTVVDAVDLRRTTTNTFHFVFKTKFKCVLEPKTYKDGIYYLDSRRRHEKMMKILNENNDLNLLA